MLSFFCYGYGLLLLALPVVGLIDRGRVNTLSYIFAGVGLALLLVPLVARAVREGKKPAPAPSWGGHQHQR